MAGCLAAMSSVTYPAISAFASEHAAPDQQGENRITNKVILISNKTFSGIMSTSLGSSVAALPVVLHYHLCCSCTLFNL